MIDISTTNAQINNPSDYNGLIAIIVRIYPDEEQQVLLAKTFGCVRFAKNTYISNKKTNDNNLREKLTKRYIKTNKPSEVNVEELKWDDLKTVKKKEEHLYSCKDASVDLINKKNTWKYRWLNEVNSKVIQQAQRDTEDSFNRHYSNPEQYGYPKFKTKHDEQSCRFPLDALQFRTETYYVDDKKKVKIIPNCIKDNTISFGSKQLKNIPFHCSKKDIEYLNINQEHIHNITLSKTKNGEYYASILIDDVERIQYEKTGQSVGIDFGLKEFCIDSDNVHLPKLFEYNERIQELEKKEQKLSQQMARKRKKISEANERNKTNPKYVKIDYNKSKNYIKIKKRHAAICKEIADIREDYLQNISHYYVYNYDIICIENLSVKNMVKNHKLARAISRCGWGRFTDLLEEKCNRYGKTLIKIDRFYPSSKTCHNCGYHKKDLTLKDREWICPECGDVIDRDYNAAKNILKEGLRCLEVYKSLDVMNI